MSEQLPLPGAPQGGPRAPWVDPAEKVVHLYDRGHWILGGGAILVPTQSKPDAGFTLKSQGRDYGTVAATFGPVRLCALVGRNNPLSQDFGWDPLSTVYLSWVRGDCG